MPRRDGTLTPQEIIAAQRAGEGPAPITTAQIPRGAATAAAIQAAHAAAQTVATAPPVIAPVLTVAAVNAAAAGILGSFDRFLSSRRDDQEQYVLGLLEAEVPELPEDQRLTLVSSELDAERTFAMKARARLDRDLPKALSITDPTIRESQVQKILDRERRYVEMREAAMTTRTLGAAEQRHVELLSPEGGYWHLSSHVKQHTLDCLAMGGKVWPHSVLRTYHPPLHGGCPCEIWTIKEAQDAGLLNHEAQYATPDQSLQAMQVVEAAFDEEDFARELEVLEAAYNERWGKGTTKAGEFRPRRGGDPGRVLRRPHPTRMHLPHLDVTPVPTLHHELDVGDLKVSDLREGDHVMVNGNLERVTKVHAASPGLVELEHTGLAHIDRDTIKGIPAEPPSAPPEAPKPPDITPPSAHGGPTFEQVERDLLTRKLGKAPEQPGPLLPGFHYAGPSDGGISYKHELHGDTLHLQQGFFRQGRDRREAIVFKHYGSRLADSLGDEGLRSLGSQDEHLSSRQRVIDTYFALNTPARDRMVDLHPDAARLVAGAAHERGLPLHPEAAKLIRRESTSDVRPPEHPAHELAKRQVGLSGRESHSQLQEAGYLYGGSSSDKEAGTLTNTFHNHDLGATITTTHDLNGPDVAVTSARATIEQPLSDAEQSVIHGLGEQDAIRVMREQGFSPGYTSSGDWLRFVHPDGRGYALKFEDGKLVKAARFTPPEKDVQGARVDVIRADPYSAAKPGDDADAIVDALHNVNSGWTMSESKNASELSSGSLPAGVEAYTRFTRHAGSSDEPPEHLVLHTKRGADGKIKIVAAGHGSLVHPHTIVNAAMREQELSAWRNARAQADAERKKRDEAAASARDELRAAAERGDKTAFEKALSGRSINEATRLLQGQGFELRGRRRAGRGKAATITYTLRGPGGSTVKLTGEHTFASQAITKIDVQANPQAGKRTRLPEGQAPKNLNELLTDALGRADELGRRYGATTHVSAIVQGGVSKGAAAHHEYNGTIAIRKDAEGKRIREYLAKRQKGEPLSEREHLDFYNAVEILQHEINHGVGKAGNGPGGMALTPGHYRGVGKNVEEALTEEMGHVLAAEWLRSHGLTDVLAAVKRNPQHHNVLGTYQEYRIQLKRLLDKAGVAESERRALLERMKFQMTPEEQYETLNGLAQTSGVHQALFGTGGIFEGGPDEAEKRREMRWHFEPILRADLSDIADDGATFTTKITNRVIRDGETVKVLGGDAIISGVVTGIRDGMVRVRTEDGLELWYTQDMVR